MCFNSDQQLVASGLVWADLYVIISIPLACRCAVFQLDVQDLVP